MKAECLELWYTATLFEMYVDFGNYSEISRKTKIPRTSVSQAVQEGREYIQATLKKRNIDFDY
jgi:DNA-directed RNA polymerase specialized sigma24 family protein